LLKEFVSSSFAYTTDNSTNTAFVSMTMTATSGLKSWNTVYRDGSTPVTTATETVYGPNGARTVTTRWNYDLYRGWLKSKDYPDAVTGQPPAQGGTGGPVYTNTPAGRLQSRVWKRAVTTAYSYNTAGDLQTIDYSDSTPDVSYTHDRRGRRVTATCNGITTSW